MESKDDEVNSSDYHLITTEELEEVDYDLLHEKIVDYLTSGKVHSTLVGMIISLNSDKSKKDVIEATAFADYFINLLKKANE